jgi:hypothetical protein
LDAPASCTAEGLCFWLICPDTPQLDKTSSHHTYAARSDHGFGLAEGATKMILQLFRLSVAALAMSGFLGADAQQPPAPQTTQTTTTTIATGTSTSPAMSKSDMKKQRKQQKHQEKAAKAEAKAAKHRADATKEQNKSVQESEKAAAPQ